MYARLAPAYDVVYGRLLRHGRREALRCLAPKAGESILELGVGTGLSALHYPPAARVVAVDLSAPMLMRAASRLRRHGIRHVRLGRMDAGQLGCADAAFDAVYAPYLLNVVPDPSRTLQEIVRVCRPHGRVVLLNHFEQPDSDVMNALIGRVAGLVSGVNWHLRLDSLLAGTGLVQLSVETVNLWRVSSVVVCRRT